MMMSSTLHVMPVFHCLLAVRPDCQIADFFFCCAPINISILCAIQCFTLDILPIYLTCSLTNVCLCVFVLAIPTTTPPDTTGRPDYCGTIQWYRDVVDLRLSVCYDVMSLRVGCSSRLHQGNRELRPGTHARTGANVAFCPGTFHGCALIF